MKKVFGIGLGIIAFLGLIMFVARPQSLESRLAESSETSSQTTAETQTQAQDIPSPEQLATIPNNFELSIADFKADTYGGGAVRLSEAAQEKPTIIGFWATWCHNCQRNMPELSAIYENYKDDVNVIMVNLSEDKSTVDNYVDDKNFSFTTAYDESGDIGAEYGIRYTNTHVLIDKNGNLVDAFPGDVTEQHFERLLQI